jgi:hypothetical protein
VSALKLETNAVQIQAKKKNKTHIKAAEEPFSRPVPIEFNHRIATKISIVGTFNDWRPGATPMVSLGDGRWFTALMLKPGNYEYQLVVDGEWMLDPRAGETVSNSFAFGQRNSVLKVDGIAPTGFCIKNQVMNRSKIEIHPVGGVNTLVIIPR